LIELQQPIEIHSSPERYSQIKILQPVSLIISLPSQFWAAGATKEVLFVGSG